MLPIFELDLLRDPRGVGVNIAVAITQMGLGLTAQVVAVWSIVLYLSGFAATQGIQMDADARVLARDRRGPRLAVLVLAAVGFAIIGLVAGT